MSQDFWLKSRPAVKIDKLQKKLVLPAFSAPCGETIQCLYWSSASTDSLQFGWAQGENFFANNFTIEAWIKIPQVAAGVIRTIAQVAGNGIGEVQLNLFLSGQNLNVRVATAAATYTLVTSATEVPTGEWVHVAATFSNGSLKLYVNGVLDANTGAPAAPLYDVGSVQGSQTWVGKNRSHTANNTDSIFLGYLDEVRLWQITLTQQQIQEKMFSPRNHTVGDSVEDDLLMYLKFNDVGVAGTNYTFTDSIDNTKIDQVTTSLVGAVQVREDGAPLKYGASFVAANSTITLSKKVSLRFPVVPEEDVNHCLIVRWLDDNDVLQRRKLYGNVGEDIAPDPAIYLGESLNSPFVLEFWNIDGRETVDLESALTLYVSDTTDPTSSMDSTNIAAATPSINENLGEAYPWSFPLGFDQPLTFD